MSHVAVKGCWTFNHERERYFEGVIERSEVAGLMPGAAVAVRFDCARGSADHTQAYRHGRYVLSGQDLTGSLDVLLASFTRQDGQNSAQAWAEGHEQLWGGEIIAWTGIGPVNQGR